MQNFCELCTLNKDSRVEYLLDEDRNGKILRIDNLDILEKIQIMLRNLDAHTATVNILR